MFDTNLVIVGNVLNAPEWRRIQSSGAMLASFRVASTARRFDRENDCWVDGNSLRVRVIAWRRLAEGVASSVTVGDPVIIHGRLYTRDWKDDNGNHRISYEMEAFAIGHDLARGRSRFFRSKTGPETTAVEDAEAESLIGGELSIPVGLADLPVGYGEGMPEPFLEEVEPTFAEPVEAPDTPAVAAAEPAAVAAEPDVGETATDDDLALEVERLVAATPPSTARRTRRAKREPVAA